MPLFYTCTLERKSRLTTKLYIILLFQPTAFNLGVWNECQLQTCNYTSHCSLLTLDEHVQQGLRYSGMCLSECLHVHFILVSHAITRQARNTSDFSLTWAVIKRDLFKNALLELTMDRLAIFCTCTLGMPLHIKEAHNVCKACIGNITCTEISVILT